MSWEEAFEHDLLKNTLKMTKKVPKELNLDDKENFSMNLAQTKKYEDLTYIKNTSTKMKRDLS